MLGLEEASELLVRDLDREVTERLPDEARVLDLLERAGDPEEGLEVLSEVRVVESRPPARAKLVSLQTCAQSRPEQRPSDGAEPSDCAGSASYVARSPSRRVAPVEEDCS